jgi:hypothetical protein
MKKKTNNLLYKPANNYLNKSIIGIESTYAMQSSTSHTSRYENFWVKFLIE